MVPALRAQGIPGAAVEGLVRDTGGVAVVDAEVLITNRSNGERWRASTSSAGRFVLEHRSEARCHVDAPCHRVRAGAARRRPAFPGPAAALGREAQAGRHEPDPYRGRAAYDPLINPGRTGPAQIIAESTIARLPIAGRNVLEIARLSPLFTGPGSVAGLNHRSQFGAGGRCQWRRPDGRGPDAGSGAGPLRTLSVEAVKEVQVLAAPFDMRYGGFSAGLVEVVTKSGSNRFEGSLSGYYTGRGLQGKDDSGGRGEQLTTTSTRRWAGRWCGTERPSSFSSGCSTPRSQRRRPSSGPIRQAGRIRLCRLSPGERDPAPEHHAVGVRRRAAAPSPTRWTCLRATA